MKSYVINNVILSGPPGRTPCRSFEPRHLHLPHHRIHGEAFLFQTVRGYSSVRQNTICGVQKRDRTLILVDCHRYRPTSSFFFRHSPDIIQIAPLGTWGAFPHIDAEIVKTA